MSRRVADPYRCPPLESLARQMLFTPPKRRIEQVRRAEQLHDELLSTQTYPLDFVVYRITGYHSEAKETNLLPGDAAQSDLRLLIDQVSWSVGIPTLPDEIIETETQLAQRLNISTKTLARWRRLGLRWRWVPASRPSQKTIAYCRVAVDRFIAAQPQRVERARAFSQLTTEEKQAILARARRLAQATQATLNQVAAHLAKRTGRGLETIRTMLEQHDQQHPDQKIFIDYTAPLTTRDKQLIARAFAWGISVSKIAQRFKRTRNTIYRAIHERRAHQLRQRMITYVGSSVFARADAQEVLLQPLPEPLHIATVGLPPAVQDLPSELSRLYARAAPEPEQVTQLLVRLNYLKFRALTLRNQLDRVTPRAGDLDQIERWLAQAHQLRQALVMAHLPIVLRAARQQMLSTAERTTSKLVELLEIGNSTLYLCVEDYDASRGQTFEAYLLWSLMRRFAYSQSAEDRKARKKLDGSAVFKRMSDTASGSGIHLAIE